MGTEFLLGGDENILKLVVMFVQLYEYPKATKLNILKGQIWWYMNILIKLLE